MRKDGDYEKEDELFGQDSSKYYFGYLRRIPLLADEEIKSLSKRILKNKDEDARNKIVEHNLRLVPSIASHFYQRHRNRPGFSMEFLDLVQEGNLGLIRAAELYDYRLGNKFSTYAYWWIKQIINRAIEDKSEIIRIPVHAQHKWRKIKTTTRFFYLKFGRKPTEREAVELLQTSEESMAQVISQMNLAPGYNSPMVFFDDGWDDADDDDNGDKEVRRNKMIVDRTRLGPESLLIAKEEFKLICDQLKFIIRLIRILPLREEDILVFKMRYGLDDSFEVQTLDDIGKQLMITRERVRQILNFIVWPKLRKLGVKKNDKWLRKKLKQIRTLEKLVGIEVAEFFNGRLNEEKSIL